MTYIVNKKPISCQKSIYAAVILMKNLSDDITQSMVDNKKHKQESALKIEIFSSIFRNYTKSSFFGATFVNYSKQITPRSWS